MNSGLRVAAAGTFALAVAAIAFVLYFSRPTLPPAASPSALPPTHSASAETTPTPTVAAGTRFATTRFAKPFTFDGPPDSEVFIGTENANYVALFAPTEQLRGYATGDSIYKGPRNELTNGIIVATTAGAALDPCPPSLGLGLTFGPTTDVVEGLRATGGFTLTSAPTTIGGRPASAVTDITATCADHLHLDGIKHTTMELNLTLRSQALYAVPFDDTSVIIQAWVAHPDEADNWLPVARQIIDSIQFAAASPSPTQTVTSSFTPEFSYKDPGWEDLTGGPTRYGNLTTAPFGARHGVYVVAISKDVHANVCCLGDTMPVRSSLHGFLADLTSVIGIPYTDPVDDTFDGRPALIADRSADAPSRTCGCSLVNGPESISADYDSLRFLGAGHSTFLDVDGTTVLIDVWADTDEELAAWTPIATQFVNSIHFTSPR